MTTPPRHPQPAPELCPFATEPGRWQRELHQTRARIAATTFDGGPGYRQEGHRGDETARIDERTDWGWLRWPAPPSDDAPVVPLQIAVLSPMPSRTARLASRWLTRRPPLRIYFDARYRFWVTSTTVLAAFLSLTLVGAAMANGLQADSGVPLMLLIPALAEHVPGRLDARARGHARIVQDETSLRAMLGFIACHQVLQAADDHQTPELAHAVALGHRLLWEIAGLLTHTPGSGTYERLLARERSLAQLARQAAGTRAAKEERERLITRTPAVGWDGTGGEQPPMSRPEKDLMPDALLDDAIETLAQAETAFRAAAAHLRQLDQSGKSARPAAAPAPSRPAPGSGHSCPTSPSVQPRGAGDQ
ncbi:hypothetical protein ACFYMW_36485 [Streptomyces sp. NPDC006692]|uniref:hypothetical protein n=1 Tax=unclassified Streptomyces TaxID=2593676 RepID=UPI0036CA0EA4